MVTNAKLALHFILRRTGHRGPSFDWAIDWCGCDHVGHLCRDSLASLFYSHCSCGRREKREVSGLEGDHGHTTQLPLFRKKGIRVGHTDEIMNSNGSEGHITTSTRFWDPFLPASLFLKRNPWFARTKWLTRRLPIYHSHRTFLFIFSLTLPLFLYQSQHRGHACN